jgi:hypothetical protein
MKQPQKLLRIVNSILGGLSIAFFAFDAVVFLQLRPQMEAFAPLAAAEEAALTWVGISLVVYLGFCLTSLLQAALHLKGREKFAPFPLMLILLGVLALLMVFADVALLGDIHKQYTHGLDQPEWRLVIPIMSGQLIIGLLFLYLHLSGFFLREKPVRVALDSNLFLTVQAVGLICGLLGLATTSLAFVVPRAWNLVTHSLIGSLTLLFPYGLALAFWGLSKLQGKEQGWVDEKQGRDIGRASFLTLIGVSLLMAGLFIANIGNLDGVLSAVWLPLHLFATIFLFSLGTLCFSSRA